MLILKRAVGQQVRIGHDITVEVLETEDLLVKLGIKAPKHITVHREEVYHRITLEKAGRAANDSDQKPSKDK